MALRYFKNVVSLSFNEEKCAGCGRCEEVCPHGVFEMSGKNARLIEKDLCMECGACSKNCPANAISVNAGVGCAYGVLMGWLSGGKLDCDCSDSVKCC